MEKEMSDKLNILLHQHRLLCEKFVVVQFGLDGEVTDDELSVEREISEKVNEITTYVNSLLK